MRNGKLAQISACVPCAWMHICTYVYVNGYWQSGLEITVDISHFLVISRDLDEQILFARANLLHIFNGEASNSL